MSLPKPTVVVVDCDENSCGVWAVTTGRLTDQRESRLAGAWIVSPSDLKDLHIWSDRYAALFSSRVKRQSIVFPGMRVEDPTTLVDAVAARVKQMQERFEAEQASRAKSKKLEEPIWPSTDYLAAIPSSNAVSALEGARALAKWLVGLCSVSEAIDDLVSSRPYLKGV